MTGRYARPHGFIVSTQAAIETLESRQMLSAEVVGNVLLVEGGASGANDIRVDLRKGAAVVRVNGVLTSVPADTFSSVRVTGGSGDDTIRIGRKFTAPVTVLAKDGNDRIDAGGGNDAIDAGPGDDVLLGRVGHDRLDGGPGNDAITGHVGDDTLVGGDGDDRLKPGAGADAVDGGAGANALSGVRPEDAVGPLPVAAPPAPAGSEIPVEGAAPPAPAPAGSEIPIEVAADDGKSPEPVIRTTAREGVAGHAVFVHALDSKLHAGSPLTARYAWDFGDAAGSYNTLVGWNAAHIYDKPGTYTVRLTVTNESGRSATASTSVTVKADNRRTIYVDPTGATKATRSGDRVVRTAAEAASLVGDDTRVLFKRGARFDVGASFSIDHSNVLVGAYGAGERPVLNRVAGDGRSIIGLYGSADRIVIQDLIFDSPYTTVADHAAKINADGIYARGSNITVRGCEFRDLTDAINSNGKPAGLLVQDNTAPLATGLRGYFVWSEGSDHVYLGNSAANSTREHNVRTVGVDRILVAHNAFTNLDRSGVDGEDYSKGTVEVHKGTFAYVAGNELRGGPLRAGPRGGGVEEPESATMWTVFEANKTFDHDVMIFPGTHHLVMRNNVIHRDGANAINIRPTDDEGRTVSDVLIANNTAVSNASNGQFIKTGGGSGNRGVTLKNNLWVAPNFVAGNDGAAPVYVAGDDLSLFAEISHNVWPDPVASDRFGEGGIHYVWPIWSDARGYRTPKEWDALPGVSDERYANVRTADNRTPAAGSAALGAAEPTAGVMTDFYGKPRPTGGAWTAGAVEAG